MRFWIPNRVAVSGLKCNNCHRPAINQSSRRHASTGPAWRRRPSLVLGRHVREALLNNSPIVALESTVITHGLPEPSNLELALRLESEIVQGLWWRDSSAASDSTNPDESQSPMLSANNRRLSSNRDDNGDTSKYSNVVTPATIGIIDGQVVVGLNRDQLEYLACRERSRPIKASRRDIPIAIAMGLSAGTTVSATMAIASSGQLSQIALGAAPGSSLSGASCLNAPASGQRSVSYGNNSPGVAGGPIKVFATGGLGGVHLGGEQSMDVSADLYEFARSPIGLVSSGFKSFLDTRRSLEFLETLGCTVTSLPASESTYQAWLHAGDPSKPPNPIELSSVSPARGHEAGGTSTGAERCSSLDRQHRGHLFPGFFSAANRERVLSPWRCADVCEAAEILFECLEAPLWRSQAGAGGPSARAMLLACPIPARFGLDLEADPEYERAMAAVGLIDQREDLAGNEKTPLILEQLNQATGGKTLRANMALLRNNARVGAHLAHEYALLAASRTGAVLPPLQPESPAGRARQRRPADVGEPELRPAAGGPAARQNPPVVIGCTMIDMHVSTRIDHQFKTNPPNSGVTFEGRPHLTLGGVGRNLACAIELLGHAPIFVTSLARGDNLSDFALAELRKFGLSVHSNRLKVSWAEVAPAARAGAQPPPGPPSACFALVLLDSISGQCEYVVADLALNRLLDPVALGQLNVLEQLSEAPLLVLDANLPAATIDFLVDFCNRHQVPVFLEPTDVVCLARLSDCLAGRSELGASNRSLAVLSPNVVELAELVANFERRRGRNEATRNGAGAPLSVGQVDQLARRLMTDHLAELQCLLVTLDKRGVLVAVRAPPSGDMDQLRLAGRLRRPAPECATIVSKHYAPPKLVASPVSVSGAGDSFAAGFISGLLADQSLAECVRRAFRASYLSLLDRDTIPSSLRTSGDD